MPRPTQPVPDDFPLYASQEGNLKLRRRYNVGGATIERWRAAIGARYAKPDTMPKRVKRPVLVRKLRKTWQHQERLEDLDDGFDLDTCVRSGGYGNW